MQNPARSFHELSKSKTRARRIVLRLEIPFDASSGSKQGRLMSIKDLLLNPGRHCPGTSLGLLTIRVVFGVFMLAGHGWGKLVGFGDLADGFPDPIGIGSSAGLVVAVFAEVFCALAIVLGLGTRVVGLPLVAVMMVAAFGVHAQDPWATKEKAILYAASFGALMLAGAGRYSLDAIVCKARGYSSMLGGGKSECSVG